MRNGLSLLVSYLIVTGSVIAFGNECKLASPIDIRTSDPRFHAADLQKDGMNFLTLKNVEFDSAPITRPLRGKTALEMEFFDVEQDGQPTGNLGVRVSDGKSVGTGFSPRIVGGDISGTRLQTDTLNVFETRETSFYRTALKVTIQNEKLVALELTWRIVEERGGFGVITDDTETLCLKSAEVKLYQAH